MGSDDRSSDLDRWQRPAPSSSHSLDHQAHREPPPSQALRVGPPVAPGRLTLTASLPPAAAPSPGPISRKADGNGVAPRADQAVAAASGSGGQPLPATLQHQFESSLGADLSGVRVHTGEASATAARSLGARAYTLGSDIHFNAGQYDPTSEAGQHLLAHEVAHTVQQAGIMRRVQTKLDVSSPGDAHESEADRAADAMVRSQPASVVSAFGISRKVMREKEGDSGMEGSKEEAMNWAKSIRSKIESVQFAVQSAQEVLDSDADAALASLKAAQNSYLSFERAYNECLATFVAGVKKATAEKEELRRNLKTVVSVAMAATGGAGLAGAVVTNTQSVLGKIDSVGQQLSDVGITPKVPETTKAAVNPGATTQTDWKELFQTSIDTLQKYIKGNKSLHAISKSCIELTPWLNSVIDGGADNPRSSTQGQRADKFAAGADSAMAMLGGISSGLVSASATAFAQSTSAALDHQDTRKIEQDIAIKWISSLARDQVDAIDDAGAYLSKIGVIDSKGNRLGVDTGSYTTEWDTVIIRARAQVEQRAKAMVGTVRGWGGGKKIGNTVVGTVQGDSTSSDWWRGVGPNNLTQNYAGQVRVLSYSIREIEKSVSSNWEHVNENKLQGKMISYVTFKVEPVGDAIVAEGTLEVDVSATLE